MIDKKKLNISLLVVSCDKYSDIWEVFFRTFRNFWPDCPFTVYLGSNYKRFDKYNVNTLAVGEDLSYSENLHKMIEYIDAEYILMWVDDLMLSSPINTNEIMKSIKYCVENNVDFLKILPNYPMAYVEESSGVGNLPVGIKYRITIGISLVKKSFLQRLAYGKNSAWDMEYRLGYENFVSDAKIYSLVDRGVATNHFGYVNVLGRGKVIRNSIRFLESNNGLTIAKNRGIQPIGKYVYYRLYLLMLNIFRAFKFHWK